MKDRAAISRVDIVGLEAETSASPPRLIELQITFDGGQYLLLIATREEIRERLKENLELPEGQRVSVRIMPMDNLHDEEALLEEIRRTSPERLRNYWQEIPDQGEGE